MTSSTCAARSTARRKKLANEGMDAKYSKLTRAADFATMRSRLPLPDAADEADSAEAELPGPAVRSCCIPLLTALPSRAELHAAG